MLILRALRAGKIVVARVITCIRTHLMSGIRLVRNKVTSAGDGKD